MLRAMSETPARVLVVEDETAIADTVLYALRSEGYVPEHCLLGREALERLRNDPADLVVLDVGLPDINGFEVCRTLRGFSEVPVIFLTARNDERSTACWVWNSVPTTTWPSRFRHASWWRGCAHGCAGAAWPWLRPNRAGSRTARSRSIATAAASATARRCCR
ncbi:hypothetical protein Xcc1_14200 [Xanthomonas campestris pv. campestris]|nr:hypothetical protein Xcc1_14200 [Xanthomonas campestris pv. campestris]